MPNQHQINTRSSSSVTYYTLHELGVLATGKTVPYRNKEFITQIKSTMLHFEFVLALRERVPVSSILSDTIQKTWGEHGGEKRHQVSKFYI